MAGTDSSSEFWGIVLVASAYIFTQHTTQTGIVTQPRVFLYDRVPYIYLILARNFIITKKQLTNLLLVSTAGFQV